MDAAGIKAIANLPNREGMLSMLLSVLQAPVRNVAYAVKAVAEANLQNNNYKELFVGRMRLAL